MTVKEFLDRNENKGEFGKQLLDERKLAILIADDDYIEMGEFLNVEDCLDRTIACWYIEVDDIVEHSVNVVIVL